MKESWFGVKLISDKQVLECVVHVSPAIFAKVCCRNVGRYSFVPLSPFMSCGLPSLIPFFLCLPSFFCSLLISLVTLFHYFLSPLSAYLLNTTYFLFILYSHIPCFMFWILFSSLTPFSYTLSTSSILPIYLFIFTCVNQ